MTTISAPAASAGSLDMRAIQRALNAGGAHLAEDGETGPATCSAIYAAVQVRVGGVAAPWSAERLRIAYEQIMLRDAGLYRGAIDGVAGPQTHAALAQWSAPVAASPAALPPWLVVARSYLGTHEAPGAKDNPKIVELYELSGHPEVEHDAVPWCAAFVGACLRKSGLPSTGTLRAIDYAGYGDRLASPVVGAIATKKRDGGGHVFFVVDFDETQIWGLGGNQSDSVNVARYSRSVIHSVSWPHGVPLPARPRDGAFRKCAVSAGSEA